MKFLENTEEFFTDQLERFGMAWWVEIVTEKPDCIYYFGPFASENDAQRYQDGYIEDLERERAILFAVTVRQGKPKNLTIFEEEAKSFKGQKLPELSSFFEANR